MKKFLSLLLVGLMMVLSLAACGGNNTDASQQSIEENTSSEVIESEASSDTSKQDSASQPTDTEESTESEPESESEQILLHLNETTQWGDFELTIIDVRLFDKDGFSVNYSTGGRKYSGSSVAVTYSLKNVGKTAASPSGNILQLNYADGYEFYANVIVNGNNPNIYANGGINTPTELAVLSSEHYYLEAFSVPEQVIDDTAGALFITLAYANSIDESPFRYDIRPIDDIQAEALYQHAIDLMNEGRYAFAFSELADMIDYKDVSELRTKCAVNCYGSKYSDYLTEHWDDFQALSDEVLSEAVTGSWRNVDDAEDWVFFEDETVDPGRTAPIDGSKVTGTWQVNGEILQITLNGANGSSTVFEYKVKQTGDFGLIFFNDENGTISITKKLAKQ